MVSLVWSIVAAMLGLLVYIAIPMLAGSLPVQLRQKIGQFYFKLAARSLKQFAFVRRILSGYDVYPIEVDDEQKLMKVTLSSSMVGDDNTYPFKDPDNRIGRLMNKPIALTYELVPAAVDAELSELGHWIGEKANNDGLNHGDMQTDDTVTVDPYVKLENNQRLIDPIDAHELVPNAVDPENVKSAEEKTKKRFEKYGGGPGAAEIMTGLMGFAAGVGAILVLEYFMSEVIGGGGGSGDLPDVPSACFTRPPTSW